MSAHSKQLVEAFCQLCDKLLQSWQFEKYLFDENPGLSDLGGPYCERLFDFLNTTLHENWFHQLAKLHDPAVQGGQNGHINLSVDYIINYGAWDTATKHKLTELRDKMSVLARPLREARNKLLSHNDLAVILLPTTELGGFAKGQDDEYFGCLRQFASLVREAVVGEPFFYDHFVKNDVDAFMKCFNRGRVS